MEISVHWFRRDLRIKDNRALTAALDSGYPVLALFIFDNEITDDSERDDARISFIHSTLEHLNNELAEYGSSLMVLKGSTSECWGSVLRQFTVRKVFFNNDYEPYSIARDTLITDLLANKGVSVYAYKDHVIFEKDEIVKDNGEAYTVFTPYRNRWLSTFQSGDAEPSVPQFPSNFLRLRYPLPPLAELGFVKSSIRVPDYDLSVIPSYHLTRDIPSKQTTGLGPHLRFGTVSTRELIKKYLYSSETFINELIWREFFMQVLYHFPHVIDHNFRVKYDGIVWRNREEEYTRWCKGKTGYPIVDAGMRQLNKSGFMHNRVRMITASFLCKHLLIDWRWGEAYFASKLTDYELSSNNGNWQWAAGTGCDAAPYFRVFNPYTQTKRYDKELKYIRTWLPELNTADYPEAIIDHSEARIRALETYAEGIKKR